MTILDYKYVKQKFLCPAFLLFHAMIFKNYISPGAREQVGGSWKIYIPESEFLKLECKFSLNLSSTRAECTSHTFTPQSGFKQLYRDCSRIFKNCVSDLYGHRERNVGNRIYTYILNKQHILITFSVSSTVISEEFVNSPFNWFRSSLGNVTDAGTVAEP